MGVLRMLKAEGLESASESEESVSSSFLLDASVPGLFDIRERTGAPIWQYTGVEAAT